MNNIVVTVLGLLRALRRRIIGVDRRGWSGFNVLSGSNYGVAAKCMIILFD